MSLFKLTQDKRIEGSIESLIDMDVLEECLQPKVDGLGRPQRIIIPPFPVKADSSPLMVDLIQTKVTLISSPLKSIFSRYVPDMSFNSLVLVHQKQGQSLPYWLIEAPLVDCLSPKSERHVDGSIKRLIIDEEKVQKTPISRIKDAPKAGMIIHLGVAESLLRRDVFGIRIEKVETSKGGREDD